MPTAVSRRQYCMMMAILHGKHVKDGGRGRPPKSVAAKYSSPGKDAPEHSGKDRGGSWTAEHHERAKGKVKEARAERKKSKKALKKAFEDYYSGKGHAAAALIIDAQNRILLGDHVHGGLACPGGSMDSADLNDCAMTALRELKEESGLVGHNPIKIWEGVEDGNHVTVFLMESWTGMPTASSELKNFKWVEPQDIKWDKLRPCCVAPLKHFIETKLGKTLKGMMALEALQKNIIRQRGDAVFEITHGEALKLVGNGLFRQLKHAVSGMGDEDFKDVHLDTYILSLRKHMNDVYSGRVSDGHKVVYQFTNKSLPEMTAALMSVFEWYLPEDEKVFDLVDEDALSDDAVEGGLNELADNYRRHNLANIYQEMETIREQIRNGNAVDLQQVEARIMKLFDKLEETVQTLSEKHNMLAEDAGHEVDELERKLLELQSKIEEMEHRPEKVEAFSMNPANKDAIIENFYPYLSRPKVEILPNGKITIMFGADWQNLEKENFLHDLRAKAVKKSGKSHG